LRLQKRCLLVVKSEHEVAREASKVATNGFVEPLRSDAIEPREIGIEDHTGTADQVDAMLNIVRRDPSRRRAASHGGVIGRGLKHLTRTPFPVMLSTRNEDFQ
jgi:hypothetical protein